MHGPVFTQHWVSAAAAYGNGLDIRQCVSAQESSMTQTCYTVITLNNHYTLEHTQLQGSQEWLQEQRSNLVKRHKASTVAFSNTYTQRQRQGPHKALRIPPTGVVETMLMTAWRCFVCGFRDVHRHSQYWAGGTRLPNSCANKYFPKTQRWFEESNER